MEGGWAGPLAVEFILAVTGAELHRDHGRGEEGDAAGAVT